MLDQEDYNRLLEEELDLLDAIDRASDVQSVAHLTALLEATPAAIRASEWHLGRAETLAARRAARNARGSIVTLPHRSAHG